MEKRSRLFTRWGWCPGIFKEIRGERVDHICTSLDMMLTFGDFDVNIIRRLKHLELFQNLVVSRFIWRYFTPDLNFWKSHSGDSAALFPAESPETQHNFQSLRRQRSSPQSLRRLNTFSKVSGGNNVIRFNEIWKLWIIQNFWVSGER